MKREKYLVRRGLMLQGILIIVSLIFLLSMSGWWAFAFSVAFIAGVCIYALNEGAYLGDKAVAMQKLIDKQQAEGREIAPERYNEVFDWRVGVRAYIYTVLPFLVLAIVNYVLFLSWPEDQANILDLVVNIRFLPYLQLFSPWLETIDLAITRLCYIPASLIVPAFVLVGYLRGPVYYERKMKEMMKGSKKKRKRLRVTPKPRKDRNQPEI